MSTERSRFIDELLDDTYEAVQHPETVSYLGQSVVDHVLTIIESTVVANVRHGEVSIPQTTEPDAIPVVALQPNERMRRGKDFSTLTDTQREAYERVFTAWDPQTISVAAAIAMITAVEQPTYLVPAPMARMAAMTSTQDFITRTDALTEEFGLQNGPTLPVVKCMFRPLVVLKLHNAAPDVACHEFIHADQKITNPIRLFGSQLDLNMDALGDETFSYHVGGGVRLGMEAAKPADQQVDPYVQMAAERIRRNFNAGKRNPFEPSELLLSTYTSRGMGHILHSVLNYDVIKQNLQMT